MRIRIKQARPENLNDAVRHAVELEAFNRAERKHLEGQGYMRNTSEKVTEAQSNLEKDVKSLQKTVAELHRAFESWKKDKQQTYSRYSIPRNRNMPQQQQQQQYQQQQQQKRKCFTCGSEDHVKPRCPLNKKKERNKTTTKETATHQTKFVANKSSGLYVDCKINNIPTECLVDIGATLSIISIKAWDIINQSSAMTLNTFKTEIYTASGNPIDVKGKMTVMVEVGGVKCITDMVVADIDIDAIHGLNFLKNNDYKLNIEDDTLELKGKTCKLNVAGRIGCYRVTVAEDVELPSRAEIVHMPIIKASDLAIIEPTQKSFITGKGIVAKALVYTGNKVPLRVVNFGQDTEKLYRGTYVADLSFVSSVHNLKMKELRSSTQANIPDHLKEPYGRAIHGLTSEQCKQVAKLLMKHESTFSESDDDIGRTGIIRHRIITKEDRPIKQPLRRLPVHMNQEADKQIDEMLKKDVIQPSASPWASRIVMVKKKDGSKRFCVDYRKLNDITVKDAYPLPRIDDSLDQLSGAEWFSCLDLNSGYWQVEVEESDRAKTAFISRQGLFEFKVMPFGLCNAPATFERLMETVLAGLNWQVCLIYLDDIIVRGKDFEDMIRNLDEVLQKLHGAGLKLKPRKCQLFAKQVEYLGHIISKEGVHTDPKKKQVVKNWPKPETLHDVRSFLGFCSYYRRFIAKFAEIARPLHKLSEKGQKFLWTDECNSAFEILKCRLVESPVLAHPDFTKPFIIDSDASDQAIGAVLSQNIDGHE